MGAINGNEFINRVNQLKNEIWFDGQKIEGLISEHSAFKGIIQEKAALYDLQLNPKFKNEMTFLSPETGDSIGLSFCSQNLKKI